MHWVMRYLVGEIRTFSVFPIAEVIYFMYFTVSLNLNMKSIVMWIMHTYSISVTWNIQLCWRKCQAYPFIDCLKNYSWFLDYLTKNRFSILKCFFDSAAKLTSQPTHPWSVVTLYSIWAYLKHLPRPSYVILPLNECSISLFTSCWEESLTSSGISTIG